MNIKGFSSNHYVVGDRVELHPGMDLWVRGARCGYIKYFNSTDRVAKVKMDSTIVKDLVTVKLEDLKNLKTLTYYDPFTMSPKPQETEGVI